MCFGAWIRAASAILAIGFRWLTLGKPSQPFIQSLTLENYLFSFRYPLGMVPASSGSAPQAVYRLRIDSQGQSFRHHDREKRPINWSMCLPCKH